MKPILDAMLEEIRQRQWPNKAVRNEYPSVYLDDVEEVVTKHLNSLTVEQILEGCKDACSAKDAAQAILNLIRSPKGGE